MIPTEIAEENLTLEVTTRCTSSCRHCFARAGRKKYFDLSETEAGDIAAEGFALGFRHLHLTGGEPLLWPKLYELIDGALSLGYENVFLNSNGHLLDKKAADTLAGFGDKLQVSISLQGHKKHHDFFRGEGSYQKAAEGIVSALEAGLALHIFTTVDSGLLHELPRFIDTVCREFNGIVSQTLIQLVRVHNDALVLNKHLLSPEEFISLVKIVSLLSLYEHPVTLLENPLAVAAAKLMGIDWLPSSKNLHRTGRMVVLADRTITLAHSTRHSFGSWEPGILKNIITSGDYHEATGEEKDHCVRCSHIETCRDSGLTRPSEWFRDMKQELYCQRVLGSISPNTSVG